MRAVAVAVAAATMLALGACSALPAGFPSPSPSGSASPSASAVPIGPAFGDVAPRESVTDELGTYLHITLAPTSPAATAVDPATVGSSIAGSSWDGDALLDAQRFVATFVAEQTIDSIALDRDLPGWEDWLAEVAPRYFGPPVPGELVKPDNGSDRPVPIFNDPDNVTPRLIRDGLPRLDDATITIDSLENLPREGGEWLAVSGTSDVTYRLSDEEAINSLLQLGFDQDAVDGVDQLADGADGHYLVHLEWTYSVERVDAGWIIRDDDLLWDATIEGVSQA
jgi:hypothetical protein